MMTLPYKDAFLLSIGRGSKDGVIDSLADLPGLLSRWPGRR